MTDWGWREDVARWLHKLAYKFYPEEPHDLVLHDADGQEIFSVAFSDGFVASHNSDDYKLYCRHYENDADMDGELIDLN